VIDPIPFAGSGLGVGLMVSALFLGLRHGVDWDHIAAITDLSVTQESPRRGLLLGLLYASGHGLVVLVIGSITIAAGRSLPDGIDEFMGRLVGVTLLLLGGYVLWSLWAHRDGFRMQSRWMLVIGGVRRLVRRMRSGDPIEHEHPHAAHADVHHDSDGGAPDQTRVHTHTHVHDPDDLAADYGPRAALAVGMLHGVGAETPTQVVTFLAAAQAGGAGAGLAVLVVFLIGLFVSNTAITLGTTYGFREAMQRPTVQRRLGAITAVMSLVLGMLFVLGMDAALPAFFGG
jgi:ABC-type nickel/cobalt efflux system permease component RcnA